jgi:hypothetical protein
MSDESLGAIENRIDAVRSDIVAVGTDLAARIGNTDKRLAELDERLSGRIDALGHQMRVLHEDTISNIKALSPDFAPLRREFHEADADLREDINRRLSPLEAIARSRRGE